MSGARLFRARTRLYLYSCCGERNHLRKFTYSSKLAVYVKARAFCQRGTMNNRPHLLISTHGCTPPASRARDTHRDSHVRDVTRACTSDQTRARCNEDAFLSSLCIITFYAAHVYEQLHFKITDSAAQFVTKFAAAAADPRGTSQIEAMTALRTRVANFSTSPTSFDNINFHRTRTINSRPRRRRFRRRQTTKQGRRMRMKRNRRWISSRETEIRRGNTNGFIIGGWRNLIFERNNENSIAYESVGILNGGEYVRDDRIADYVIFRKSMFELYRDERI